MQRSQEVVRSRVLLRSHTEAAGSAHYDYNPRREQGGGGRVACRASHLWEGSCVNGSNCRVGRERRSRCLPACLPVGPSSPLPLLLLLLLLLPLSSSSQWSGEVHARLSHAMFRFADDQDVRLTAGVRAPLSQQVTLMMMRVCLHARPPACPHLLGCEVLHCRTDSTVALHCIALTFASTPLPANTACYAWQGLGAAKPYVRVQENCWALTVQAGGQWSVSYDL